MKKLLPLMMTAIVLWLSACGAGDTASVEYVTLLTQEEAIERQLPEYTAEDSATEEYTPEIETSYELEESTPIITPDSSTEEEPPESTPLLITEEGIVWIVPPTFEYDRISYCSQCGFIDSQRRIIDPITGEWEGLYGGHGGGGGFSGFVYDRERHLFGEPLYGSGYDGWHLGMHPFDEAVAKFGYYGLNLNQGFFIVQAVDSTMRHYWGDDSWSLERGAFLSLFAVMYNGEFVTDFIFDDGFEWWNYDWIEGYSSVAAMSLDGMWGTVCSYGNVQIPFIFEYMRSFGGDRALAVYEGKQGLIDRYGNILVPFLFDEIYHFGLGRHPLWLVAVHNGRHGLIDESGNTVIPFLFDHLFGIDSNTAFAKYDGLYGIIDIHQTIANAVQQ